jgi:LPXTG-motif cell wall-anchored protein
MAEADDLSDIGDFLTGITSDIVSADKTFTSPSQVPVPGAAVPGRPGYVYGAGGAIFPVSPSTGLPVVNSSLTSTGVSTTTVVLLLGVAVLGVAFFVSVRK